MELTVDALNLAAEARERRQPIVAALVAAVTVLPLGSSPEFTSVAAAAIVLGLLVLNRLRIPRGWALPALPLAAIVVIGLAGAEHGLNRDVARDVWYLGKSILLFVLGYSLAWYAEDLRGVLRGLVIGGGVTAAAHLAEFLFNPELLAEGLVEIRHQAGVGFLITALSVAILAGCRRAGWALFRRRWIEVVVVVLCLASLTFSFSRTFFFSLLILLFATCGGLDFLRPSGYTLQTARRALVLGGTVLLLATIGYKIAQRSEAGTLFVSKLMRSAEEVAIRDYTQRPDISENWRGYQAYRVWQDYLDGSTVQWVIGHGYGSVIDMGVYSHLGSTYTRYVPTLHNGYFYLLQKAGPLGIALYLAFFVYLIRFGHGLAREASAEHRLTGELLVGCCLLLLATTLTVAGLMNKVSMNPAILLLGAAHAHGFGLRLEEEPDAA